MYCRICGSSLREKAEICVNCGCKPLNGNEHCQECGTKTTEKQEMCVKCGCRLKKSSFINNPTGISTTFTNGVDLNGSVSTTENLDFSNLPPYYQQEFQKIYDSNETYKGKFNVMALLFGCFWALSKGLWLPTLIVFIVSLFTYGFIGVVYLFIFSFRGTYMYYNAYVKGQQCLF